MVVGQLLRRWPGVPAVSIRGEGDVLRLHEVFERVGTALATETRALDPPERRSRVGHQATVHADHADVEALADGHRARNVSSEQIARKSVLRIVCEGDGLIDRVDDEQGRHRGEEFLTGKLGSLVPHRQDCRLEEVAVAAHRLTAHKHIGLRADDTLDYAGDRLPLCFGDHRPDVDPRPVPRSDDQIAHLIDEQLGELRGDTLLQDDPVRGDTGLPRVAEFRGDGITDYVAMPMRFVNGEVQIISYATDRPRGFTKSHMKFLRQILPLITRLTEVHVLRSTAVDLLDAYLGKQSGARVLDGQVKRGDGQDIHAVIWFSDLRDSTPLAERLGRQEFLAVLNDYLECMAGAVLDHGGEVLRFIGDAALAIFPIAIS